MGNCKGLKGKALEQCLRLEKNIKAIQARSKKQDSAVNASIAARKVREKKAHAKLVARTKKRDSLVNARISDLKKQEKKKTESNNKYYQRKVDSILSQREATKKANKKK